MKIAFPSFNEWKCSVLNKLNSRNNLTLLFHKFKNSDQNKSQQSVLTHPDILSKFFTLSANTE